MLLPSDEEEQEEEDALDQVAVFFLELSLAEVLDFLMGVEVLGGFTGLFLLLEGAGSACVRNWSCEQGMGCFQHWI